MKRIFPCAVPQVQCCNMCSYHRKSKDTSSKPGECEEDSSRKSQSESPAIGSEGGDLFRDYCENTTIHGVKYIGQPQQRLPDRLWWIISFLISIVLCTYLIRNLWIKWDETPVFVSFSEQTTPVWEIPFPAGAKK